MGCRDLKSLVPSTRTYLSNYSGQTLAIDAAHWFDRYLYTIRKKLPESHIIEYNKEKFDITQSLLLLGSIPDLLGKNITPVFFFDPKFSSPNTVKNTKIPHLEAVPEKGHAEKHTPYLQRPTEVLLQYLDIQYFECVRNAEADACVFNRQGYADAVVSNDYDTILYGAETSIRKNRNTNKWEEWQLERVYKSNSINRRELLDTAILLGTDEVSGPHQGHPNEALEKVKNCDDIDSFEKSENKNLRHPSLKLSDNAPTFSQLHDHYVDPPTVQFNEFSSPSFPDPDFSAIVGFLHEYLNYSGGKEITGRVKECTED
jgi:flap endonuclease-1